VAFRIPLQHVGNFIYLLLCGGHAFPQCVALKTHFVEFMLPPAARAKDQAPAVRNSGQSPDTSEAGVFGNRLGRHPDID